MSSVLMEYGNPSQVNLSAKPQRMSRFQKAYFYIFLLALVLCWSPSNILGYLAPWIGIIGFFILSRNKSTVQNFLLVIGAWTLAVFIYSLLTPNFVLHSALLTLLTYGSFLFALIIPGRALANDYLRNRMLSIASGLLLFQSCWGIGQAIVSFIRVGTFDGAAGDVVAGTIRPFTVYPDFSNPMFAVNISLLLLILFPYLLKERRKSLLLVIGGFSLVLASVLHTLLFMATAISVAVFLFYPSFLLRKRGITFLIGASLLAIIAANLLGNNFATVRNFALYTIEGRTVRAQVVKDVFTVIPSKYFWMPVIGFGPGQFTSRASLIGTGLYFGGPQNPRPLPLLPQDMSQPFRDYILERWLSIQADGVNNSSTSQPYFSWLSVFTEFGLLGFLLVVFLVVNILLKLRRLSRRVDARSRLIVLSLGGSVIFLFLLGLQENYWEVSQATFIGLILLKLQYANLVQLARNFTTSGGSL